MLPLQILYLDLVIDVFPAFALAMGEGDRDILKRPPRNPKSDPRPLELDHHCAAQSGGPAGTFAPWLPRGYGWTSTANLR